MAIMAYEENGKSYFRVYVQVRGRDNKGLRVQKSKFGIDSEKAARKEELRLLQEASREISTREGRGLEWGNIVERFLCNLKADPGRPVGKRTLYDYESILRKWTSKWWGIPAVDLNKADGRELIIQMTREGLAKSYIRKVKNLVNMVYEWAVQMRHTDNHNSGPTKGLKVEKGERKIPEILTLEEMREFLFQAKVVEHPWYPVWTMACMTGMRSGELHALTWDKVDMEKDIIYVHKSYCSNQKVAGSTKGRYWRTVPISPSLKEILLKLRCELDGSDYVLPRFKDWDNGEQAAPLRSFLESIKVRSVKFHTLRACFATQMLANGVAAPIVMKIGGWQKSETMDIYLRLAGVDVRGATDELDVIS